MFMFFLSNEAFSPEPNCVRTSCGLCPLKLLIHAAARTRNKKGQDGCLQTVEVIT